MHTRKLLLALIAAATLALVAPTLSAPAQAVTGVATAQPHRSAPRLSVTAHVIRTHTVRLAGRTPARHGRVAIQRRTAAGWQVIARADVRSHRFTRRVLQTAPADHYRVVGRHARSRVLAVRLPAAPQTATAAGNPGGIDSPTTIATQTAQVAPTDGCGVRPAKADGSLWSCTFDDEFSGTTLDRTKWIPQTVFKSGTPTDFACYRDDPSNVAVADGTLDLTVRRESTPQPCAALPGQSSPYTAGMVSTYHRFSQQYGRFEVRMESPTYAGAGLQDDFWLWPDDRFPSTAVWPAAGEIDVVEHYSSYETLDVPFLHYGTNANLPGLTTAWNCAIRPGAYNTYTLTWAPTRLEIDVNGRACLVNTSGDAAFQKPYIVALSEGLGAGLNGLTSLTSLPATLKVDYVRVWS